MKKKRTKDFQKKKFSNPFFQKKGSSARVIRNKLYAIVGSVIGLGLFYFFGFSSFFNITNITVGGADRIGEGTVQSIIEDQTSKRRFMIFSQKNILFFNTKPAREKLESNFLIDNVEISRKGLHTVNVQIQEKVSGVVWATEAGQFYLDRDGIVIRELGHDDLVVQSIGDGTEIIRPEAQTGNYPVVHDRSNGAIEVGSSATSDQLVNFMIALSEALEKQVPVDISYFYVERPYLPEVIMVTRAGWEVRFTADGDPLGQVQTLQALLNQEIRNPNDLEYIDLRFGERIFYK